MLCDLLLPPPPQLPLLHLSGHYSPSFIHSTLVDLTQFYERCSFLPFPMWQVKAMTEKTTKEVEQILHSAEHKA
jgi:hypothetical protein